MSTEEPIATPAESSISSKPVIEDRIYVGNVDFKATEDELKELFEGLKVTEVDIPFKENTRGEKTFKRHLGFAFVQFENKEEADKAITEYNGKKFQRRHIFIKKAVPPPTEEEKKVRVEAFKAKREVYLAEKEKKKSEAAAAKKEKEAAKAKETPKGENGEDAKEKAPDGKPSLDTIFVTNLNYDVTVKTLNTLFRDLKPKWIHVPARKVPFHILKKNQGRRKNKGIAFVKFANEETQKQAVAEFNGKEINGREIIVDIAIDARTPKEEEVKEAQAAEEKVAAEVAKAVEADAASKKASKEAAEEASAPKEDPEEEKQEE